jgi:hypothetical protein
VVSHPKGRISFKDALGQGERISFYLERGLVTEASETCSLKENKIITFRQL